MAVILSLETSTEVCSVALHENGSLINELVINEAQAHAARLAPLIEQLLHSASIKVTSLSAVAISSGPGSYTGLRIGTSTAKGLCYGVRVPLLAVPTLHLMAYQASLTNPDRLMLCPMIDAKRMEVYCQVFDPGMTIITSVEARVIEENSFSELLSHHKMLFFGNGAAKCRDVIKSPNAFFTDGLTPRASFLGRMAYGKFLNNDVEDLISFKPFYLKEFVAKKAHPLLG